MMITTLLLSSFYAIQLASSPEAGPDLVSAATSPPAPTPVPTPAPVQTPTPSTVTWSDTPSIWAKAELLAAEQNGLTLNDLMNKYNKPITRLEFTKLIVNLHQSTAGIITSPAILAFFKDTSSLDVAKAYSIGLVYGESSSRFNPYGLLTRQEAAVIFQKEWLKFHSAYIAPSIEMNFSDSNKMAAWAKEASIFMVSAGLMKGNDYNQLDPLVNTTREQAMILVLRSFQKSAVITTPDAITSATGNGESNYENESD